MTLWSLHRALASSGCREELEFVNPIQGTGCTADMCFDTVPRKNIQMRLKQRDSWKEMQITSRRPIYLSQQFEELMKINMFIEERS